MDQRQRTGYLVLAVVLGHVILISAQVNAGPRTSVLESVTFGVFAELQRMLTSGRDTVTGVWSSYVGLRDTHAENEALSSTVAQLTLELQAQRTLARRAERLEELLEMRDAVAVPTTSARVIASDATPYFRTLTLDRGLDDGVVTDAAVLAPAGVVGRIVGSPVRRAARVQLSLSAENPCNSTNGSPRPPSL